MSSFGWTKQQWLGQAWPSLRIAKEEAWQSGYGRYKYCGLRADLFSTPPTLQAQILRAFSRAVCLQLVCSMPAELLERACKVWACWISGDREYGWLLPSG